jgi:hypothetical protein
MSAFCQLKSSADFRMHYLISKYTHDKVGGSLPINAAVFVHSRLYAVVRLACRARITPGSLTKIPALRPSQWMR